MKTIIEILNQNFCTFETLEMVRGKAVSFILTNPMTKLFIRYMNQTIADALRLKTWKNSMKIHLRPELKNELIEWIKLDFLKMRHSWWPTLNKDQRPYKVTFTDSSTFAIGVKIQFDNKFYQYTEYFSENEQNLPICQKEAIAIYKMLHKCNQILANTILIHFCDNSNVVHGYNGLGSKNRPMNEWILKIYKILREMNSTLKMYWCSTKLQLADQPSRQINMNEEFLPQMRFNQLCKTYNIRPDIDLMATPANTKAKLFVAWGRTYNIPQDQNICIGSDFFAFNPKPYKSKVMYIFPPKAITTKVAIHLAKYYQKIKYIFIFHSFMELPLGLENLINQGARLIEWNEEKISIIPSENKLEFQNQIYAGKWNQRNKVTYILLNNI